MSLPPQVDGPVYGQLRVFIPKFAWSNTQQQPPEKVIAAFRWWGEGLTDPAHEFQPALLGEPGRVDRTAVDSESRLFAVRCELDSFFAYLKDAQTLTIEIQDAQTNERFATALVPYLDRLNQTNHWNLWGMYPVTDIKTGLTVGNLQVGLQLQESPKASEGAEPVKSTTHANAGNDITKKLDSLFSRAQKLKDAFKNVEDADREPAGEDESDLDEDDLIVRELNAKGIKNLLEISNPLSIERHLETLELNQTLPTTTADHAGIFHFDLVSLQLFSLPPDIMHSNINMVIHLPSGESFNIKHIKMNRQGDVFLSSASSVTRLHLMEPNEENLDHLCVIFDVTIETTDASVVRGVTGLAYRDLLEMDNQRPIHHLALFQSSSIVLEKIFEKSIDDLFAPSLSSKVIGRVDFSIKKVIGRPSPTTAIRADPTTREIPEEKSADSQKALKPIYLLVDITDVRFVGLKEKFDVYLKAKFPFLSAKIESSPICVEGRQAELDFYYTFPLPRSQEFFDAQKRQSFIVEVWSGNQSNQSDEPNFIGLTKLPSQHLFSILPQHFISQDSNKEPIVFPSAEYCIQDPLSGLVRGWMRCSIAAGNLAQIQKMTSSKKKQQQELSTPTHSFNISLSLKQLAVVWKLAGKTFKLSVETPIPCEVKESSEQIFSCGMMQGNVSKLLVFNIDDPELAKWKFKSIECHLMMKERTIWKRAGRFEIPISLIIQHQGRLENMWFSLRDEIFGGITIGAASISISADLSGLGIAAAVPSVPISPKIPEDIKASFSIHLPVSILSNFNVVETALSWEIADDTSNAKISSGDLPTSVTLPATSHVEISSWINLADFTSVVLRSTYILLTFDYLKTKCMLMLPTVKLRDRITANDSHWDTFKCQFHYLTEILALHPAIESELDGPQLKEVGVDLSIAVCPPVTLKRNVLKSSFNSTHPASCKISILNAMNMPRLRDLNDYLPHVNDSEYPRVYVSFEWAEPPFKKFSTPVSEPKKCPCWQKDFEIQINAINCSDWMTKSLLFSVWHCIDERQPSSQDRLIGTCRVDMKPLTTGLPVIDGWYEVKATQRRVGQLRVQIHPPSSADSIRPPRTLSPRHISVSGNQRDDLRRSLNAMSSLVHTIEQRLMRASSNPSYAKIESLTVAQPVSKTESAGSHTHAVDFDESQRPLTLEDLQQWPSDDAHRNASNQTLMNSQESSCSLLSVPRRNPETPLFSHLNDVSEEAEALCTETNNHQKPDVKVRRKIKDLASQLTEEEQLRIRRIYSQPFAVSVENLNERSPISPSQNEKNCDQNEFPRFTASVGWDFGNERAQSHTDEIGRKNEKDTNIDHYQNP